MKTKTTKRRRPDIYTQHIRLLKKQPECARDHFVNGVGLFRFLDRDAVGKCGCAVDLGDGDMRTLGARPPGLVSYGSKHSPLLRDRYNPKAWPVFARVQRWADRFHKRRLPRTLAAELKRAGGFR